MSGRLPGARVRLVAWEASEDQGDQGGQHQRHGRQQEHRPGPLPVALEIVEQEPEDRFQSRNSLPVNLRKTLSKVGFWTDKSANSRLALLRRSTKEASP